MPSRTLPGIGLNGFWNEGDEWKAGGDQNWLKLSALTQLTLSQAPATALPASPADGFIAIDPANGQVCVRDSGAWVRITPNAGWLAVFDGSIFYFNGASWSDVLAAYSRALDRGFLDSGADLNALMTEGLYKINSGAIGGSLVGGPPWLRSVAGNLIITRASNGVFIQELNQTIGTGDGIERSFRYVTATSQSIWQIISAGASSPTVPSGNAITQTGSFRVTSADAAAMGLPLSLEHMIQHQAGAGPANGHQFAAPLTSVAANRNRLWHRQMNSSAWTAFQEFAYLDSTFPNLKLGNAPSADVHTLDHYEEGTWTPVLRGGTTAGSPTYSTQQGRFTRIGNRVMYSLYVAISNKGGMAGQVQIAGLPYPVANSVGARGATSISYLAQANLTANVPIGGFHGHNRNDVQFYKQVTTGAPTILNDGEITDSFSIYASGQYEA